MNRPVVLVALAATLLVPPMSAQSPMAERDARLSLLLPPAAAAAVRARASEARAQGLPAEALVLRALELSAKGAGPAEVVRRIESLARRLSLSDMALRLGGRSQPRPDEILAGADAIASGLAPGQLRILATEGLPAEPLTARLIAVANLLDRGLPSDDALAIVAARLGPPVSRPPHAPAVVDAAGPGSPPTVPTATGRGRNLPGRPAEPLPPFPAPGPVS